MMKAYKVSPKDESYSMVVFAETRNKAKVFATHLDLLDYPEYIDLEARRMPIADKMYKNRSYMDWNNEQDRLFLVKECCWHCDLDCKDDCEICIAKKYCDYYKDCDQRIDWSVKK